MSDVKRRGLCAALALALLLGTSAAEEDGAQVLQTEQALYALGYHSERCDGEMDAETVAALKSFQIANDLRVTGEMDEETLALLNGGESVTCYEYLSAMAQEYAGAPILQLGSSGDEVQHTQTRLAELGYFTGDCDGVYGEDTERAARTFQLAEGLAQTGLVDQALRLRLWQGEAVRWEDFLNEACASVGAEGANVRRLQRRLKALGYFDGDCSGEYGERTRSAVAAFQCSNGLEENGEADFATCERLYSGTATAVRESGTLYVGCSGEMVISVQRRLFDLGYFNRTVTGSFGVTTATAVRLFQMANDLACTGEVDSATRALIAENGVGLEGVRERFSTQVAECSGIAVGDFASRMRGSEFVLGESEEQEGFAFVQYVLTAMGVPVVEPVDLAVRVTEPVEDAAMLESGDVVRMRIERSDGIRLLWAVASGDGRVIYATSESTWVLESHLDQLGATEILRWPAGRMAQ